MTLTTTNSATSPGAPTQQFRGRIGVTLIGAFVLLAIIPAIILVAVTVLQATEQAEDRAFEQMRSQAEVKANDIERWLSSAQITMVLILANSDQQDRMVTIVESDRTLTTATNLQVDFLQDQLAVQEDFSEFFLVNAEGTVRVSTDEAMLNTDVSPAPFVELGLSGQSVQPPYFDQERGSLQMIVMQPLDNDDGETVGFFAGRLRLEVIEDIMTTRVGLGDTGETYLVTADEQRFVTPSRFAGYAVGESYSSEGITAALAGSNDSGVYENYTGAEVIGVYRWLPDLQMGVLAEIQRDEVLAVINDTRTLVIIIGAVVALLAASVGVAVSLWITRPITTLTRTAASVIEGDYSQRTPITRNNEIGQLTASFNAMTDRLLENIAELDKRVEEINETNKQLRAATAQAREASRVKGEFLATMSHELRTPLNAIIGFSDMLLMGMSGPLNEQQTHRLERLRQNGGRLLELINDILDVTRIEAGRIELEHEQFSPVALCERLGEQMSVLSEERKLDFELSISDDLPATLIGDEKRIEQTIVNLLSNAFKFTEEGSVTLKAWKEAQDNTWCVSVRDTGVGIPPHAIELIFDEFRQLDGSTRRAYGGTGLGLSITRNLVRMMDGQIKVESTLGEGSTFTLVFPIEMPEKVPDKA